MAQKALLIRLSSIGDVVLTTPVIRSLKRARPEIELHYLTKAAYAPVLEGNPYIDRLHLFSSSLRGSLHELRGEGFDFILDLHDNPRSSLLRRLLGGRSVAFDKRNLEKLRIVYAGWPGAVAHVVERYGACLQLVGASLDEGGLDFFLHPEESKRAGAILNQAFGRRPVRVFGLGATHNTKKWLADHFIELGALIAAPIVLVGGAAESPDASRIEAGLRRLGVPVLNLCSKTYLRMSAAIVDQAHSIITHDTGLMHIAAARQRPLVSIWGSTTPRFGMYPYRCAHKIVQVDDLECRPCDKLGRRECPRGHFRCMGRISAEMVFAALQEVEAETARRAAPKKRSRSG